MSKRAYRKALKDLAGHALMLGHWTDEFLSGEAANPPQLAHWDELVEMFNEAERAKRDGRSGR